VFAEKARRRCGLFHGSNKILRNLVGAGLLAMAPGQATSLLNDEP
jgi:hypothetical protein